jgi:hypothetical protein
VGASRSLNLELEMIALLLMYINTVARGLA